MLNFARVDVSNVGGLTEAKKVAGWCETHYIDMMPHNPLGPITTAASIHFAIATPNFAYLEYQHRIADDYPRRPLPDRCPTSTAPTSRSRPPPVSASPSTKTPPDHAFEYWEAPHWQRRDGSYTNW